MAMSLQGDTSHLFIEFKAGVSDEPNPQKSKEAGRPIFDAVERVSVQHVGDQKTWPWFPAHERSIYIRDRGGSGRYVTYAENFYEHYKAFKEGQERAQSGTPVEELPFLSAAKRAELKALNIHTAESLAQLEGTPLTRLGMGGREMKNQAQAYLDRAKEGAIDAKLAAQNARLEEELAAMREQLAAMKRFTVVTEKKAVREEMPVEPPSDFDDWSTDELRTLIKDRTGTAVRGRPAHDTLVRMAQEATAVSEVRYGD